MKKQKRNKADPKWTVVIQFQEPTIVLTAPREITGTQVFVTPASSAAKAIAIVREYIQAKQSVEGLSFMGRFRRALDYEIVCAVEGGNIEACGTEIVIDSATLMSE